MGDKKIGICLAGFGNFGKHIYSYLQKLNRWHVKYLYHPDQKKAQFYGPLGLSDLSAVCNDPDIEAFIIATPNDQHFGLLRRLLQLGRHHIFVEKPMVDDFSQALVLRELAVANKKVFMVGHNQRREAGFRRIKALLDDNVIGKLVNVNFNFSHGGAYNTKPGDWRFSAARHKDGPLITLGSHCIDTIHYLFGRIESVYAMIENLSDKTEAPDCNAVLARLANGAAVFLQANYNVPSEKYCIISGTDGVIYLNRDSLFLRIGRDWAKTPSKPMLMEIAFVDAIEEELNEFFYAIIEGKPVETGFSEGFEVVKVLSTCHQSWLKKLPVPV